MTITAEQTTPEQFRQDVLDVLSVAGEDGVVIYRETTNADSRPVQLDPEGMAGVHEINIGRPDAYPAGRGFFECCEILADTGRAHLRRATRSDPGRTVVEVRAFANRELGLW